MGPLAVAHRAGNSLEALAAGVAAGADVLEADVHVARGALEVRHLKTLGPLPWLWDRTGTGPVPSPRDRWELVRRTPQLRLEELLEAAQGAALMLDLKGAGGVGPAVARSLSARPPSTPVLVCARWWPSVLAFDGVEGAQQVLSARGGAELGRLRRRLRDRRVPAPHGVSVHRSLLSEPVVAELHERVELVMTWPVNDDEVLREVLALGVDAVISDDERVLRAVAAGRR